MPRGQKTPIGESVLLPSCGSQELNSDHQVRHESNFFALSHLAGPRMSFYIIYDDLKSSDFRLTVHQ